MGIKVRRQAVDWIDVAQDGYQCRTFVDMIIKLQV
jgi:hypothetical protein